MFAPSAKSTLVDSSACFVVWGIELIPAEILVRDL